MLAVFLAMSFNIHLLDNLSQDDAEGLLEDYIGGAIDQFVESKAGKAYVKKHPEGGGEWISAFIEMGYLYCDRTLPKITKGVAQEIMEDILPRKLTLLDPDDTKDAIPELVAFWIFLKDEYELRSAGAIAKYLTPIQDKFTDWMFDPHRAGLTKSFVLQGTAAGYDMTTQAGVEAFQTEYNQNLRAANDEQPAPESLSTAPPEVQQMLEMMGVKLPEAGESLNPSQFIGQLINASEQMNALMGEDEKLFDAAELEELRQIQSEAPDEFIQLGEALPEESAALLQAQAITETAPGTVLQDFQTVLEAIGPVGISVSGKRQHIPRQLLEEINERLVNPIQIDIQRPQQKSYPPIHGLYLLLRATGMITFTAKGKQSHLAIAPNIHQSWQQLNPTERYCTLLEAWLVRSHAEMLNEDRSGFMTEGENSLQGWQMFAQKRKHTYNKYALQDNIRYYPKYHNLALMSLFSLVNITTGKPQKGKGWRIKSVEVLPFGNAVMSLIRNAFYASGFSWPSATDSSLPFNKLQPTLQPFFPEWQQTLATPSTEFSPGRHIFKVSLGKIWRRIAISGEATLAHLSSLILDSVSFDSDHLDMFTYTNSLGRQIQVLHPYMNEGEQFTDEVTIGSLPLTLGSTMDYVFDFGDNWRFKVQLESVEAEESDSDYKIKAAKKRGSKRGKSRQKSAGEILETHGKAPLQYPDSDW